MKFLRSLHIAAAFLLVQSFLLPAAALAQGQADINASIRKEGMEKSKIMNTLRYLTDHYGPRLTGSPNHVAAANWAAREMTSWGFENAAVEPWDFGHPGWVNERAVGLMTSPQHDTLTFEVLAWTPSTKGKIKPAAFNMILPERPTQEELTTYFNSVKSQHQGQSNICRPSRGRPGYDHTAGKTACRRCC